MNARRAENWLKGLFGIVVQNIKWSYNIISQLRKKIREIATSQISLFTFSVRSKKFVKSLNHKFVCLQFQSEA